ncbi:MAG TPA: hypothetical protein VGV37_06400 [Aliidongia sp.]|uniref:hypothetical protein n=1 Tax=Aliidongia sp. TaxID=1914230 RepID=UPI002DDD52BE|nr:hypothetical protein [Aliidongia sp.]HEV2674156.1 hypothetical protein [Aliidongia sp.]
MAVTATDIVNQALQLVGGDIQPVTGVSPSFDDSDAGLAAQRLYVPAVSTVARSFGFDFSRNAVQLQPSGNTPPAPWAFEYLYPPISIEIRQLMPTAIDPNDPIPVDWVTDNNIVNGRSTKVIQTNFSPVMAVYTNQPPESLWDPLFREAVVRLLANEFSMALDGKPDIANMSLEQYTDFMQVAVTRQD